jgi:DNA-directed RNA polymerase subunit L
MKLPVVRDLSVVKLIPAVPARYKHLLPTALTQESCSFIIDGCNNAVANGIRRVIMCELKVAYLSCKYEDIVTTDPFIIPEMIQKRLRMIPLLQSVPAGAIFNLNVTNNTLDVIDVKTGQLQSKTARGVFDETITILSMGAGHNLQINNVRVDHEYGYVQEYGMCAVAFNAVSTCKDAVPIDTYVQSGRNEMGLLPTEAGDRLDIPSVSVPRTEIPSVNVPSVNVPSAKVPSAKVPITGVHSQISDPRVWEIKFNTNGTMNSRAIITAACAEIISRLKKVLSLLYTIINNESQYTLTIQGESDTIGNLLVKTIDELYPDVEAATYSVPSIERSITVKIIYSDDINTLYKNVVNHLVAIYEKIADSI